MANTWHQRAWWQILFLAAAVVLPAQLAEAAPSPGCRDVFRAETTLTLSGKTIQGAKNAFSDTIALELTAGPASATGVPIVAGTVRSERLKGGAVSWRSRTGSRWGNLCMDVVAPDGRRWSFLALTWEDDNAHPNLHAAIDWAAGDDAEIVGFIDTKDGAYHEAQAILERGTRAAAQIPAPQSGEAPETAHGSLCDVLFGGNAGHFFVGRGYATQPGTSPGHLAIHLNPGARKGNATPLTGRYIATEGPHELERHVVTAENSACIDMPDPRYAMLQIKDSRGAAMVLWLWGEDNVPQKDDRMMGYLTFPNSSVVRSKIALWRL